MCAKLVFAEIPVLSAATTLYRADSLVPVNNLGTRRVADHGVQRLMGLMVDSS